MIDLTKDKLMTRQDFNELIHAINRSDLEKVKKLTTGWKKHKYSLDFALGEAAEHGDLEMIKYLVSIGCDPKANNSYPIRAAVFFDHLKVAQFLQLCTNTDKLSKMLVEEMLK